LDTLTKMIDPVIPVVALLLDCSTILVKVNPSMSDRETTYAPG
jgi:hypothetical protein